MDIFSILKRFQHHGVLCDMRQQTQLKLRIIRGNDLVSLFGHEGAPDTPAKFGANGNVLQIGLAGRKAAGGGHGLIQQAVNSSVRRNLMRQGVV